MARNSYPCDQATPSAILPPTPTRTQNTGTVPLVIWAFGNRLNYEVCEYPDHGVAFVEGLGSEIPLAQLTQSDWTEERRQR